MALMTGPPRGAHLLEAVQPEASERGERVGGSVGAGGICCWFAEYCSGLHDPAMVMNLPLGVRGLRRCNLFHDMHINMLHA